MAISGAELEFLLRMRDEASRVLAQFGQTTQHAGDQVDNLANRFNTLTRAARDFAAVMAGGALVKGISAQTLGTFREYQNRMTMVAKTTDQNSQQMAEFSAAIDKAALSMKGIQIGDLQEIAQVAGQVGITGTKNILKFSETMAKLQRSSNVKGEAGATDLARTMGLTDTGMDQVEKFADILVELGRTMKADESQILSMATVFSQATSKFKLGYQNVLALSAEGADLGFKPELFASVTGRALNQLENAAVGNTKAMRQFSLATGITADQFAKLIKENPTQAFLTFLDTLKRVQDSGASVQQFLQDWNLYAEENQRVLGTAAQNADKFREALSKAAREGAIPEQYGALNKSYAKTFENLDTAVLDLNDTWTIFTKNLGNALAPAAVSGLHVLQGAVLGLNNAFTALPDTAQQFIAWGGLIATAVIPAAASFRLLRAALQVVLPGFEVLAGTGFARVIAGFLRLSNLTRIYIGLTNGLAAAFDAFGAVTVRAIASASVFSAGLGPLELAAKAAAVAVRNIGVAARLSLPAVAALITYKGLTSTPVEGYKSAQKANPNLLIDMANQRKLEAQYPSGIEGGFGRIGGYADLAPKPNDGKPLDVVTAALKKQTAFWRENSDAISENEDIRRAGQKTMLQNPTGAFPKQLLEEYDKALQKLDKFRDAQNEVQQQQYALEALTKLSNDPLNTSVKGGPNNATPEQLNRMNNLLTVAKRLADPFEQMKYDLGIEQQQVAAITVADQNRLEINNALRKLLEDKGEVLDKEKATLTDILKKTQDIRAASEFSKETYSLDKELQQAMARNGINRQNVDIEQKINDYIRDRANLTEGQVQQYRQQLQLIANINALNSIQDRADPQVSGMRQYLDDIARLGAALKANLITQQEYNREVANLNAMNLQARDPLGARLRDMQDEVNLLQYQGREQEIQRQTLQEINQLRDQGVQLDAKAKEQIEAYVRAMQTAKEAQSTGFQAWANQLGTMQQQIGNLQQQIATSLSDGITDGLMTGNFAQAGQNIAQQLARSFIQAGVNNMMQSVIQRLQNPANPAASQAQNALNSLHDVATANLNAATAIVNASTVSVVGATGIPGVPGLNSGLTPSNLPMGLNPRTPSTFQQAYNAGIPAGTGDVETQIRAYAQSIGIDPNTAVAVARSEGGLNSWNMQSKVPMAGGPGGFEPSYGPYQMYMNGGLGSQFMKDTGLDPRDAANGPAAMRYALDHAKTDGWTDFHGAANSGISRWQGITPGQSSQMTTPGVDTTAVTSSIQKMNTTLQQTTATSTNLANASTQANTNLQQFSQSTQQVTPAVNQASNAVQQLQTKAASTQPAVSNLGATVASVQQPAAQTTGALGGLGQGFMQLFQGLGQIGGSAIGGIGSIFQTIFGGLFHEGGSVAGGGAPFVDFASNWRSAPKYHTGGGSGLNNDEYRAILKKNERVLTEQDDMRTNNILKAKSAGGGYTQNVFAPTIPITVQASGNKDTDDRMKEALMQEMDTLLDAKMQKFMLDNQRPGGMASPSGKRGFH